MRGPVVLASLAAAVVVFCLAAAAVVSDAALMPAAFALTAFAFLVERWP